MENRPLISVITIFYNSARFLAEAVESVLAQSYDRWELLLVDDGSGDASSAIASEFSALHPGRIRYLEHSGHQNLGMSASRNLGIAHARGEFIAFLDSDDVWLPPNLERQMAALSSQPEAAMVYGPAEWWYSWTGLAPDTERDFVPPPALPVGALIRPPDLLTHFLRREGASPCTCAALLRRDVVERVGGFAERFRGMYEDQAFFAKIALEAPVLVSGECWCRYRQHPDSNCAVAQRTGLHETARLAFLDWLSTYLTYRRVTDAGLWSALRAEMWPYRHPVLNRLLAFARQAPGRVAQAAVGLLGRDEPRSAGAKARRLRTER